MATALRAVVEFFFLNSFLLLFSYSLSFSLLGLPQILICGKRRKRNHYTSYAVTQSWIAASDDKITAFITKGTEINFRFCRKSCFFQNIPYLPRGKPEGFGGIGSRIDTACRRLVANESY